MAQFEKRDFPESNRTAYELTDDDGQTAGTLSSDGRGSLCIAWMARNPGRRIEG